MYMGSSKQQEPSQLAEEGAALLQSKCDADAIRVFSEAMAGLREFIDYHSKKHAQICYRDWDDNGDDCSPSIVQVRVPPLEDDRFYIHNYAMLFRADVKTLLQDASSLDVSCAVTCYNMGLGFHSLGHGENQSEKALKSAAHFYRTCLGVVGKNICCSKDLSLLALAALNNLSCICFSFGDMKEYDEIYGK